MFKNLKKYKIILIDEKTLGVKEISSKSLFYSIIGAVFCFFIFLFISFYSTDINKFLSLKSILWHKSKNVELQNLVKEQDKKIDILIDQIDSLSKRDENLRKIIKLPPIDNDIRKLGVGGAKKTNKIINDINYLLPDDIEYDFLDRINFIKRSVNLENLSYSEIEEYTNKKLEELLHYPGIYPISRKISRFTSGYGYKILYKSNSSFFIALSILNACIDLSKLSSVICQKSLCLPIRLLSHVYSNCVFLQ